MNKYKIIYADPPWSFNNKKTGGGKMTSGASQHYQTMDLEQMCKLPIKELADDHCVLFMWWVGSQPEEAIKVVNNWGFKVKTMTGFNWVKTTKNKIIPESIMNILQPIINKFGLTLIFGKLFFGMGFWTRAGSECCLIATKGNPKRINASIRSVILEPIDIHSRKPNVFRTEIIKLMGDVPRIELFARQQLEGFDVFGNEVENSIKL